ncbi:MAG TPA: sugar phosphate isomerase/epimerase family protein [Candidatus Hydrogenedentes bacterium]|nr:sugar phosphate isomerase/epimerase family protein [Candidatus Hydrogenedentota bacterium]HPG68624.1 sugar phosphate isomerase/epimerase family protein [Candidatus Hydrogenedentota bacterium]
MAQISIMTMVFGGELEAGTLDDVELLEALDAMGFDGVEVPAARFRHRPELLEGYAAYLAHSSLEVPCVDGGCHFIAADAATREEGVAALTAAIEVAATLGAPLVLAAGSRLSSGISPEEGRRMIIDGLRACMPAAEAKGITLAIENFGVAPTLQCAGEDCRAVLDGVPGLRFVLDSGNFYFAGESPVEHLDALGPRTCHVHLKDWVKSATPQIADVSGCALGEGLIPNAEVIRYFLDRGDVEWFSLELGAPGDKLEASKRDLATIRGWLE